MTKLRFNEIFSIQFTVVEFDGVPSPKPCAPYRGLTSPCTPFNSGTHEKYHFRKWNRVIIISKQTNQTMYLFFLW